MEGADSHIYLRWDGDGSAVGRLRGPCAPWGDPGGEQVGVLICGVGAAGDGGRGAPYGNWDATLSALLSSRCCSVLHSRRVFDMLAVRFEATVLIAAINEWL